MPTPDVIKFSRTVGLAFSLLGLVVLYRRSSFGWLLLIAGVALCLAGLFIPNAVRPVYRAWMGFSRLLGEIMSRLILTIVYYGIVTPIGLFAKIAHKKFLLTDSNEATPTYWQEREKKDTTYERQF